jgi:tetratricopeptide (TPR) repeat protein
MRVLLVVLCVLAVQADAAPKKNQAPAKSPPVKAPQAGTQPAVKPQEKAPQDEAQKAHAHGLRAFQKGDLDAARASFRRVLELSPANAPALINLALIDQRQRKFSDAEQHLKQVLRNDPENASAWLILGIAAYDQEKLDAAHANLAQAVLYAPKNPQAHQYLGVTLGRKGWYAAGEEELRRAVELDAKFADAHYNLAVLYMERVPPAVELARRHYQIALELGAAPDPSLARKIGD